MEIKIDSAYDEERDAMMKKALFVILLCMGLGCSGCGKSGNLEYMETHEKTEYGDNEKTYEDGMETYENTGFKNNVESAENVKEFFEAVTDEMLNVCDTYPSLEEYWNASLVLLAQFQGVSLYGIRTGEETAMLLFIEGEKILIEEDPFPSFCNFYQERPKLNVFDADNDGVKEVLISLRTVTGSISRYTMLVCDYEDKWKIYMYDDYLRDIENLIKYKYDDKSNVITFQDDNGTVLWKGKLPNWTGEYAYTGVVNFEDHMNYDAKTMQMNVVPQIELENSLPYEPIKFVFDISFVDGDFKITDYDIRIFRIWTDLDAETYINEYVIISDDTEIEGYEWMQCDKGLQTSELVLRVKIQFKEEPADTYRHKEDYFLFINENGAVSQMLVADYEDKGIHVRLNEGTECENNHYLGEGCDFDARFEDVTFDGKEDLIIFVGNSRHASYYCAYIWEDDGFRYEKTFEHIPSYEVKEDEKVICGSDTDGMGWYVDVVYEYKDGEFVPVNYIEKE